MIVDEDVFVRRVNGERCFLSSLTGSCALLVLGPTMQTLGDLFRVPTPTVDDGPLVLGIQRIQPEQAIGGPDFVYDDDGATPTLLGMTAMPAALFVRGVTPLGPAIVGSAKIRHLLMRFNPQRRRRVSGALDLGDLIG